MATAPEQAAKAASRNPRRERPCLDTREAKHRAPPSAQFSGRKGGTAALELAGRRVKLPDVEVDTPVSHEQVLALLAKGPLLLFDGSCGVCNRSVQWILAHESRSDLRFLPLESELGVALRKKAAISPTVDSLVWLEAQAGEVKARIYSAAAISAARYVGGGFGVLAWALWLIPRPLRDLAYRAFARVRHYVAPRACFLPTPEERLRFLN